MSHAIGLESANARAKDAPLRSAAVRICHWAGVLSVLGLALSGFGILISHPRLYWGETGAVGAPSLIDLPLPMIIGPSVWNRPIHFLFAWFLVFAGTGYILNALLTRHLRDDLLPEKADLDWTRIRAVIAAHLRGKRAAGEDEWRYNVVQRLTYLGVVFLVFPAILWTGLSMSPALMTVFPWMVTILGGHQSARTLHFVFVVLLMAFVVVHIAMLVAAGFLRHVMAMITGHAPSKGRSR